MTRSNSRKAQETALAAKRKIKKTRKVKSSDDSDPDYTPPRREKQDEWDLSDNGSTSQDSSSSEERKPRARKKPAKAKPAGWTSPWAPKKKKSYDEADGDFGNFGDDDNESEGGGGGGDDYGGNDGGDDDGGGCVNRAWVKIHKAENQHEPADLYSEQAREFVDLIETPDVDLNTEENRATLGDLLSGVRIASIIPSIRKWLHFNPVPSAAFLKNEDGTLNLGATGFISGLLDWGQDNRNALKDIVYAFANSFGPELDIAATKTVEDNCADRVNLALRMQTFRDAHPLDTDLERYFCIPPMRSKTHLFTFMVPAYSIMQLREIVYPDMPISRAKAIQKAWHQKEIGDTNLEAVLHLAVECAGFIEALNEPRIRRRAKKMRTFLNRQADNPLAQFLGRKAHNFDAIRPVEEYESRPNLEVNLVQEIPTRAWGDEAALESIKNNNHSPYSYIFEEDNDARGIMFAVLEEHGMNIYEFATLVAKQLGMQPVVQRAPKMSGAHVDISDEGYLGCLCAWGKTHKAIFLNVLNSIFIPQASTEERLNRIFESNFIAVRDVLERATKGKPPNFEKYGVGTPLCDDHNIFMWNVPRYSAAALLTGDNSIGIAGSRRKGMQLGWNRFLNGALNTLFLRCFYDKFVSLAKSIAANAKILENLRKLGKKRVLASSLYKLAKEFSEETETEEDD